MTKPKKASRAKKRALTQFTCFKKLAPELRHMIWKMSFLEANLVEISAVGQAKEVEGEMIEEVTVSSPYKSPVLLQISQESRTVAKERFKKFFENNTGNRPIYFNIEIDILSISDIFTFTWVFANSWGSSRRHEPLRLHEVAAPVIEKIHRLHFRINFPFRGSKIMRQVLENMGKPEFVFIQKRRSRIPNRADNWLKTIKQDIERRWESVGGGNSIYAPPELHVLTDSQMFKMVASCPFNLKLQEMLILGRIVLTILSKQS
jgi:hypothetical protein